jgi:hypothetical protein
MTGLTSPSAYLTGAQRMTDCTERSEGQEGMPKEGTA